MFDYTVGANDRTGNLAITAVNLNGATVQDLSDTWFALIFRALGDIAERDVTRMRERAQPSRRNPTLQAG